jgi:P4 family phage/plasmid primase-like protien
MGNNDKIAGGPPGNKQKTAEANTASALSAKNKNGSETVSKETGRGSGSGSGNEIFGKEMDRKSGNEISGQKRNGRSGNEISKTSPPGDAGANGYAIPVHDFSPDDFLTDEWIDNLYTDPRRLTLYEKDMCFHNHDAKGKPTGVIDERIYKYLTHTQHIFVCGRIPYIYQGGYYHMDLNGTMIKTLIKACCLEQYVKSTTTDRIFKLFLQDCALEKYPEDLNAHSSKYINFENGMYDVVDNVMYKHSPKTMSVNQIPGQYDPDGDHGSGIEVEKFLRFAIPDRDDREMLLEYIGLCCTIDVHQQKMLIITGDGGTGKSTVINLIQKIVGKRNTSNVAMSKLSENFQAIRMMGKLLNSCADLEIDALDDVTMMKKLIGEDAISDSFKGKDIVSFDNYAKLLFSTNELPLVRNEKTDGFYRRLLILNMNEKPIKRDPNLNKKLEKEIPYLIHISMNALRRLYKRGGILESSGSLERIRQLRNDSDTIEAFINEKCVPSAETNRLERSELYKAYCQYCEGEERQSHKKNAFFKAMRNKGYGEVKLHGYWYFAGISFKADDGGEFVSIPDGPQGDIPFDA